MKVLTFFSSLEAKAFNSSLWTAGSPKPKRCSIFSHNSFPQRKKNVDAGEIEGTYKIFTIIRSKRTTTLICTIKNYRFVTFEDWILHLSTIEKGNCSITYIGTISQIVIVVTISLNFGFASLHCNRNKNTIWYCCYCQIRIFLPWIINKNGEVFRSAKHIELESTFWRHFCCCYYYSLLSNILFLLWLFCHVILSNVMFKT